jgi:hypothetical protein
LGGYSSSDTGKQHAELLLAHLFLVLSFERMTGRGGGGC